MRASCNSSLSVYANRALPLLLLAILCCSICRNCSNSTTVSCIHRLCGRTQVRSHAQKHFIRLEKKGLGDVVPPARRKARWADKRSAGFCDNASESEQDFSALHQQTSSSSMSTLDHQAIYPFPAVQSLEGQSAGLQGCTYMRLSFQEHCLFASVLHVL